jgi:hypothetical protein
VTNHKSIKSIKKAAETIQPVAKNKEGLLKTSQSRKEVKKSSNIKLQWLNKKKKTIL